jgi:hypothetical protein
MENLVGKFEKKLQFKFNKNTLVKTLMILFLLVSFKSLSQNDVSIYSKLNFENSDLLSQNEKRKFDSFSTTNKPSIYLENNQEKLKDENYISLFTDYTSFANSINLVQNPELIEYVAIKIKSISEINSNINLSILSNFSNIRYIHVIFEYDISNIDAENLIILPSSNCLVIYESRKIM